MDDITLTVAQIKDLAEFAGLTLHSRFTPSEDELETEITITACPPSGMKDDNGDVKHYALLAYCTDCPDEGCMPLGDEVSPTKSMPPAPQAPAHATAAMQLAGGAVAIDHTGVDTPAGTVGWLTASRVWAAMYQANAQPSPAKGTP